MINRVKNPTVYKLMDDIDNIKTYLVIGNIGAGKSTMCNKIAHIFKDETEKITSETKKRYKINGSFRIKTVLKIHYSIDFSTRIQKSHAG